MLPPNHQRLVDLLKSLDLNWPRGVTFRIHYDETPNKTASITINQTQFDPQYDKVELKLDGLTVGQA